MYCLEYDQGCGEWIDPVNHKFNIQSRADDFSWGTQVGLSYLYFIL